MHLNVSVQFRIGAVGSHGECFHGVPACFSRPNQASGGSRCGEGSVVGLRGRHGCKFAFAAGQPGETPSDDKLNALVRVADEDIPVATSAALLLSGDWLYCYAPGEQLSGTSLEHELMY